jgi:hypothetical protein
MKVSKREFESPRFRTMLQRSNRGIDTACLSVHQLVKWVRAEFEAFLIFLKEIIAECYEISMGNPFAQGLHDGGTLENKQKYQVYGLQFIPPDFDQNLVVMVGLLPSSNGTDAGVAELLIKTTEERTGKPMSAIVANLMQDRAAKGVSRELGLDEEVCGMHDTDKLGRSATGQLVRSKSKMPVNPFPDGVKLMKKANDMGTFFSYGKRHDLLMDTGKVLRGIPNVRIQVALNGTRVASQHNLLYNEVRLNRALKMFGSANACEWELTKKEWKALGEFDAVLDITRITSTLMQYETIFPGAYSYLI